MSGIVSGPPRSGPSYASPPPAPTRQAPGPALFWPTVQDSSDFVTVLNRYRTSLLDAKVRGDPEALSRANRQKAWLDNQLQAAENQISTSRANIQRFVNEYAGSTSDIEQVRRQFQEVRNRGPVLQDVYETDEKRRSEEGKTYNLTPIYAKSVLIVGLGVVAGLVARRM